MDKRVILLSLLLHVFAFTSDMGREGEAVVEIEQLIYIAGQRNKCVRVYTKKSLSADGRSFL